ncbi:type IX secretion/gliding motility protein PorT/SprT [Vaginella massiliensis]|uniref:type IX secretion/gliding motility protein PorT/SprT n=1 Tax=Vaginella massiliensis TaxID=1816680 RepID=UPI000838038A|nr:porin family protein [Vaginella massiliensis]
MKAKLLLIATVLGISSFGQFRPNYDKEWNREFTDQKKFSFGFYLGTNLLSYKVVPKEFSDNGIQDDGADQDGMVYLAQENSPGFSVGLVGRMRVNDYIDLKTEPGIHFAERTLYFRNVGLVNEADYKRDVKSTYVEIPILINFHGNRWFNTRPYMQGGFGYMMNLQSNQDKEDDNLAGVFRTTTNNFNWQAEIGVDIYFKKFKMTPALKGVFFFNNEMVRDKDEENYPNYTGTLYDLKTRGVFLSLKFE